MLAAQNLASFGGIQKTAKIHGLMFYIIYDLGLLFQDLLGNDVKICVLLLEMILSGRGGGEEPVVDVLPQVALLVLLEAIEKPRQRSL